MKISGNGPDKARNIGGAGATEGVTTSKEKRRTPKTEVDTGVSDKVAISGNAKEFAKAQSVAKSSPDVDEARVARLRAAIQSGAYNVDAEKVADRLVDEHLANSF